MAYSITSYKWYKSISKKIEMSNGCIMMADEMRLEGGAYYLWWKYLGADTDEQRAKGIHDSSS